jgi:hypothetical protein
MPTQYERDDRRRLITVVVTNPYTVEDLFAVIDRQFAEGTWPTPCCTTRERSNRSSASPTRSASPIIPHASDKVMPAALSQTA